MQKTTQLYTSVLLSVAMVCLAACATPSKPPVPTPVPAPVATTKASKPEPKPEPQDPWSWYERDDLQLKFKLPSNWQTRDDDGLLFALPVPEDDAVIIFMSIKDRDKKSIDAALKRIDGVLPMTDVKHTRQHAKDVINGIQATLGEGSGTSTDLNTPFYFLIVLLDLESQYTLVATYIEEDVFEDRSLVFGEILKSIGPLKVD